MHRRKRASKGRELGCYTVGVVTCKPTQKEADEYYHHCIVEHADWSAVDGILALKNISPQTVPMQEYLTKRNQYAQGMGGLPIVGDPDTVAAQLADLSKAGLTGIAISLVNYINELPFFCDEVMPRLERIGLARKSATVGQTTYGQVVIARSDSDEATQLLSPDLDCFAPLAMTWG